MGIANSINTISRAIDYRVFYVKRRGTLVVGQRHYLALLLGLLRGTWRPDVVVTSLWWSHPAGWLLKQVGVTWVAFMHSTGFSNKVDRFVNTWAWQRADGRLVDSESTRSFMSTFASLPADCVPYVFADRTDATGWQARQFDLIWVGRAVAVKRLDLLLQFLNELGNIGARVQAAVCIAGEIPQALIEYARHSVHQIEMHHNCENRTVQDIMRRSKFYALFSDYEGMSMSTIEAVQSACVPIVRPVGEIPSYLNPRSRVTLAGSSKEHLAQAAKQFVRLSADESQDEVATIIASAQAGVGALKTYNAELVACLKRAIANAK